MKKKIVSILIMIIAAVSAWTYYTLLYKDASSDQVKLYGNMDIRQVSLAFEVSGRIISLAVEEGNAVKKGDCLAKLDVTSLELQAEKIKAEIGECEENLRKMRNGSRQEEIDKAEAALNGAQARLQQALRDSKRLSTLRKTNAVSQQDMEKANTALSVAESNRNEAQKTLDLLNAGFRQEDIAIAENRLKTARASLAIVEHNISLGNLYAPSDAVVSSRILEPGDMASPSSPVLLLSLVHPKWARVYATETQLGYIQPGMKAEIYIDSYKEPIAGHVGYIASTAEFTPKNVQTEDLRTSLLYEIRIVTEDLNDILRLGMPVTVILRTGEKQNAR